MFALIVSTIITARFLIFPVVTVSEYAIQNLTEVQCHRLAERLKSETKEGSTTQSTRTYCLRID